MVVRLGAQVIREQHEMLEAARSYVERVESISARTHEQLQRMIAQLS